jgi:sporulation protein YlmC with PRC-barrel domain
MKARDPIKLVSQLIDLPILDKDGRWSGIVDDIEFDGGPPKQTRIGALLVGPGAYRGRLPGWAYWLTTKIAGSRIVRVPMNEIAEVGAVVKLKSAAEKLGLHRVEDKVRKLIPRGGAL